MRDSRRDGAGGVLRRLGDRDRDARPRHCAHDPEHAHGRPSRRDLHGARGLERPGDLDSGDRRRNRSPARGLGARLPGRQDRRLRLPRLARPAGDRRGSPRSREAGRSRAAELLVPARAAEQPREPEDGRVLPEPAAAVRGLVLAAPRPWADVLPDDPRLADRVRNRRRARRGFPQPAGDPPRGRSSHRRGARRARSPPRDRARASGRRRRALASAGDRVAGSPRGLVRAHRGESSERNAPGARPRRREVAGDEGRDAPPVRGRRPAAEPRRDGAGDRNRHLGPALVDARRARLRPAARSRALRGADSLAPRL